MEPITSGRSPTHAMRGREARWFAHWSGFRIVRASIGLGIAGTMPLLQYAIIGPADGHPIGLGLLAMVTMSFALVGLAVGTVRIIVQRLLDDGR
jgi:hypothetical protein